MIVLLIDLITREELTMSKNWGVKELVLDLVSVRSDTFTKMELDISNRIYEILAEQDYWKENPELIGQYDGNDVIGRTIPWAMRKGTTKKTLILTGHMDCVEIDCYGTLKPYATNPAKLKEEMLKMDFKGDVRKDLEDDNWMFGRGVADMKGGLGVLMHQLMEATRENVNPEVNLLFVGIPDEEHQAEGIMQSIGLFEELKEKYGLSYDLLVNGEPHLKVDPTKYIYYDGSIGKMLPGIVVGGKIAHVGNILTGLNCTGVASNIARKIELNIDLMCEDFGRKATPPTVLYMKDSKNEYNVTVPEFTEIYAHIPLTKNVSCVSMYGKLKELCKEAVDESIATYNKAYDFAKEGLPREVFNYQIMTYEELDDYCKKNVPDYENWKKALMEEKIEAVNSGEELIQTGAGFEIIEKTIVISKITDPVIVIGLLPPYVPAVNNNYMPEFDRVAMIDLVADVLKEFDREIEIDPYFMCLSDNSYISCSNVEDDIEAFKNLVTPRELYDIPFERIGKLAPPSIIVGPGVKEYHTPTERVWLPDLVEIMPRIVKTIIKEF